MKNRINAGDIPEPFGSHLRLSARTEQTTANTDALFVWFVFIVFYLNE